MDGRSDRIRLRCLREGKSAKPHAKRKEDVHWKHAVTASRPVSARRRSSWMLARQAFVRWFHLQTPASVSARRGGEEGRNARARVAVEHRRGLDRLLAALAALALEEVVRLCQQNQVSFVVVDQKSKQEQTWHAASLYWKSWRRLSPV